MKNSFTDLSEAELASMIENAQKALKDRQEGKRKEVLAQIRELAASIGVGIEITDNVKPSSRKGGRVPIKYQNPNNQSEKWTGRGMKPKWLQILLDQGRSIDEFQIGS
jgi:DNA-binding protein H-NS